MDNDEALSKKCRTAKTAPRRVAAADPSLSTSSYSNFLQILHHIDESAIAHLDLQEMLHDVLGQIRVATSTDETAIFLLSGDGSNLDLVATCGLHEANRDDLRVPVGQGIIGHIATKRKPRIVHDLSRISGENPQLWGRFHSFLGAPLQVGDRLFGVICLATTRPRRFAADDVQLLQILAGRIALAVEHAQLYQSEHAARHSAESLAEQLRALQALSDVALEHIELDELLQALLEHMQQMFGVENVAILLPTRDAQELTLYTVHGPEAAVIGEVHVPMGEGIAGTIAASRQPLIVDNLAAVPVVNPFLQEHFHSLLGVPLLADDQLIGVIHVDTVQPRHFTQSDLEQLQALAGRIARPIMRAQQYEYARQRQYHANTQIAALQETNERMDEFLNIAAHELRTPLTSLTANIQLLDFWNDTSTGKRPGETLASYITRANSKAGPLIKSALASVRRLERLVGDLIDASRIRENRMALRLQPANLVAVVRAVVHEHQQLQRNRPIHLKVPDADHVANKGASGMADRGAYPPPVVLADPDQVAQAISIYLSNALKFSGAEDPVVVTMDRTATNAYVSVRDSGLGIPVTAQQSIWERFFRVENAGHQSGSQVGFGLGLYICRDIVERHGGQVGVVSTPGHGSTFWLSLPLVQLEQSRLISDDSHL